MERRSPYVLIGAAMILFIAAVAGLFEHDPADSGDLLERFDNTELELELRDGRRVPVILGHCRVPANEGGVIYALDLSAFRRAEARRQRVESLHAAVLASLHDQVAVLDSRGAVIEINDSWRHAVDAAPPSRFDRVLVPRQWRFVPRLPSDERGKLTAAGLQRLFHRTQDAPASILPTLSVLLVP